MPQGSHPIATAHWKRGLEARDASSLLVLRDQLDELESHPGWQAVMELLDDGHDAVLAQMLLPGPPVNGKAANKQLGYLAGLAELKTVTEAIREVVAGREAKLKAEAERQAEQEGAS